jgi:hypothetical protein
MKVQTTNTALRNRLLCSTKPSGTATHPNTMRTKSTTLLSHLGQEFYSHLFEQCFCFLRFWSRILFGSKQGCVFYTYELVLEKHEFQNVRAVIKFWFEEQKKILRLFRG